MSDYLAIVTICLLAVIVIFLAWAVLYLYQTGLALKEMVKEIKALRPKS